MPDGPMVTALAHVADSRSSIQAKVKICDHIFSRRFSLEKSD